MSKQKSKINNKINILQDTSLKPFILPVFIWSHLRDKGRFTIVEKLELLRITDVGY